MEFRPETLGIFVKVEGMEVMMNHDDIFYPIHLHGSCVFFFIVAKGIGTDFFLLRCLNMNSCATQFLRNPEMIFQSKLIGERM